MSEIRTSHIGNGFKNEEEAILETGLFGWKRLVMGGYGFEGDDDCANLQFSTEYSEAGINIVTLFFGENVIGTLVLDRKNYFGNISTYGIRGIVILPEFQGKGLGKKLFREAINTFNVEIFTARSKNPSFIASIGSATRDINFRSFYGLYEVTSAENCGKTEAHREFLDKYLNARGHKDLDQNCVYLVGTDNLLPNIPETGSYPKHIQEAFCPIIEKQRTVGNSKTAVAPLLSLKAELLV